jgi:NAD(P)-dependent dehydrogenase (short-subunit alcohol dehydrogenase family)
MQKQNKPEKQRKPQSQSRPGDEFKMDPHPVFDRPEVKGSGKLKGKVALITGGDSGIGRAIAVLFAKEGADLAIAYLSEKRDAKDTKKMIRDRGANCILLEGDIGKEKHCETIIKRTVEEYGRIDILVNNAGTQYEEKSIEEITTKHLMRTFHSNFFSMFWITKNALSYIPKGGCIINSASVTAYRGSGGLIDYSSTKGAIVSFTRSLSANLADKGIRVNAVAPGPVWTPLIVSSFKPEKVAEFGSETPLKRAGQPVEIATSYLFLASEDASYMTGQVLHPNGGEIING